MKTKVFSDCVKNEIKNWFRRGYLVYHDEVIHFTAGSVGDLCTVCLICPTYSTVCNLGRGKWLDRLDRFL